MILTKILLALTIPLTLAAVTLAWANLGANAIKAIQGEMPGNQRWGEAE